MYGNNLCFYLPCSVCIQSDVETSPPQAVNKPGLDTGPQSPALTTEESNSNIDMGSSDRPKEEQSISGKKVVRVVRRVVRCVIPAGTEQQNQPAVSEAAKAASTADSGLKTAKACNEDKDDISMGLTSLMGRVRTKEHRLRTRTQDRKENVKEEVKKDEEKEKMVEEGEKPTVDKTEEAMSVLAPNPPPPKPPVPKPDPLAPPAGFIPVLKQNLLTPPPGFIPVRKSSPVPPKQNPLARPPGFIPVTKADPLAHPTEFLPKPHPVAVKKPEVLIEKKCMFAI